MISIWWAAGVLWVVWAILFVVILVLQSRIKALERDLKDAIWMRDYWEGVAIDRGKKED